MACPGRDQPVHAGDWTAMIGSTDELAARGIKVPRPTATRSHHSWLRRISDAARAVRDDVNPMLFPALVAALTLVARVNGRGSALLHPEAVVARRLVLHLRDDHNGGLRRIHLRPTSRMAATVRRRTDVFRRARYRAPRRVPCRPAAVAPLRPISWTPPGAPPAQPRRRRRAGFIRHPRRQ